MGGHSHFFNCRQRTRHVLGARRISAYKDITEWDANGKKTAKTFHVRLGYFYSGRASHVVHVRRRLLPRALAVITVVLGAVSCPHSAVPLKGSTTRKAKRMWWITGRGECRVWRYEVCVMCLLGPFWAPFFMLMMKELVFGVHQNGKIIKYIWLIYTFKY